MSESVLTTKQAADILGVHPVTMRKWREKSVKFTSIIMEDCQGLHWWLMHPKKAVYVADTVLRLKELFDRRKTK